MNPVFSTLPDRIIRGEEKLALIGLGYVGMPIAVEFAKHVGVIGFNHNEKRIQQYICEQVYLSRKKDYDNIYRQATYRNQAEMEAAIGTIEDNSFVQIGRAFV